MQNIHNMINKYVSLYENKQKLENTKSSEVSVIFNETNLTENRNVELKGFKNDHIGMLEFTLNEYKKITESSIKELSLDELELLKSKITLDINRLQRELEITDTSMHTYNKGIKDALLQKRFNMLEQHSNLVVEKYMLYSNTRTKLNTYLIFIDLIEIQINEKLGIKTKTKKIS